MKKILSIIIAAVFIMALAACSSDSAPDFVEAEGITLLDVASGDKIKPVDTEEYRAGVVERYNAVTQTAPYEENMSVKWQIVLATGEGEVIMLANLGDGKFNVSVIEDGSSTKYLVVNEELAEYCEAELFTPKEVSVDVNVKIAVGDGAPDDAGKVLFEKKVTVIGTDASLPTAKDAIVTALGELDTEAKVNETTGRITAVSGYAETASSEDGTVTHVYWAYSVNGNETPASDLASFVLTDGDSVETTFISATVNA